MFKNGLRVYVYVISKYKPNATGADPAPNDKNTGSFIGILERLIMLLLLAAGQAGAIGFVLAAKSIVRYEKVSKEPAFAEYYLLGTLLSSLLVISIYMLVRIIQQF